MNTVVSVNVGLPKNVEWRGTLVRTAIWKQPVQGRILATRLNLDLLTSFQPSPISVKSSSRSSVAPVSKYIWARPKKPSCVAVSLNTSRTQSRSNASSIF